MNLPTSALRSIDIPDVMELDRDVKKGFIKSLFAFFMVAVFCLPSLARVVEHCPPSQADHHEHQHLNQQVESHGDTLHKNQNESSSPDKHDCRCPAHRTSCCQVTYSSNSNQAFPFFSRTSTSYSEALFKIKPGPDLEGPFQPPRV